MYVNAWPIGSDTIRGCGLGGNESLWGQALRSHAQAVFSVAHSLLLLPENQDVDLSAPSPAPRLPEHKHVPP